MKQIEIDQNLGAGNGQPMPVFAAATDSISAQEQEYELALQRWADDGGAPGRKEADE